MTDNILVTGSNSQLGSEFKKLSKNYPEFNFFFRDIDLDISNKIKLRKMLIDKNNIFTTH